MMDNDDVDQSAIFGLVVGVFQRTNYFSLLIYSNIRKVLANSLQSATPLRLHEGLGWVFCFADDAISSAAAGRWPTGNGCLDDE